jgi:hypothetical protein
MSDERPSLKQEITSGDESRNYQAGGDMHVHNHAAPAPPAASSIERPTNAQIAKFDPKIAKLIRVITNSQWSTLPSPTLLFFLPLLLPLLRKQSSLMAFLVFLFRVRAFFEHPLTRAVTRTVTILSGIVLIVWLWKMLPG